MADLEGLGHLARVGSGHGCHHGAGVGIENVDALGGIDQLAGDAHLFLCLDRQLRLHHFLHGQILQTT